MPDFWKSKTQDTEDKINWWETAREFATEMWRDMPFNPYYWKSPREKALQRQEEIYQEYYELTGIDVSAMGKEDTRPIWRRTELRGARPGLPPPSTPWIPSEGTRERITPGERFWGEWVAPMAVLSGLPTATAGWKALSVTKGGGWDVAKGLLPKGVEVTAKGLEIGAKTALSPLYAMEQAPGVALKPIRKVVGKAISTYEQKLEGHRIARELGLTKAQYEKLASQTTGKKSMANMTEDEANAFIETMGRREIDIPFTDVGQQSAKTKARLLARELAESMGAKAEKPLAITKKTMQKPFTVATSEKIHGFTARTYRVERLLEKYDGYPTFPTTGKMTQTFWNPVERVSDEKLFQIYGKIDEFRALLGSKNIGLKNLLTRQVTIDDIPFTTAERMGFYLHSRNPDNLNHLKFGNLWGYTREKGEVYVNNLIKRVSESLTDDEKTIANFFFKHWQDDTPKMAEAYKIATGKNMKVVENYVPIVIKGEITSLEDAISKEVLYRYTRKYPSTMIKKGFTRARTGKAKQEMELDVVRLWLDRLPEAEHYKLFSPVIRDIQRVYLDSTFRASFKGRWGKAEYDVLGQWLKDVAATNPLKARQFSERMLQKLRVNATTAVLGWNITTCLKQFPSYMIGMAEIGEMPALKGLFASVVDSKGTSELIKRLAPQIWKRSFEREIAEAQLMKSIEKRVMGQLSPREVFMFLTTTMDKFVVKGIWRGAFDNAMRRGFSEKLSAQYATKAIRRTQPFFGMKDVPEFWRSGEFMKALTMFTNQLNQYWNYYRFDVFGRMGAGKMSPLEATRRVFEGFVIPSLMIGWVTRSRVPDNAKDIMTDMGSMALSSLPVFGHFLTSGLRGFQDSQGLITTEILDKLQQFAYSVNAESWGKMPELLAQMGGYATGIPTAQPTRTIKGLIELAEGKTDDLLRLIWGSYTRQMGEGGKPSYGGIEPSGISPGGIKPSGGIYP